MSVMGWLLGALLAIALPGLCLAYWLTGDDHRGVHRGPVYAGRHRLPTDLEGPTVVIRDGRSTKFLVTSEHDTR